MEAEVRGALAFLRGAERLKDTLRTSRTSSGRPESVAEHTWRLCLTALAFGPALRAEGVDLGRLLAILVVHDLGEALSGDVPATERGTPRALAKAERERADLVALSAPLPGGARAEVLALWEEYEAAATPEGRIAKGLDKLETILQHLEGRNAPGFDHAFDLDYGRERTDAHPLLAAARAVLDEETRARVVTVAWEAPGPT